MSTPVYVCPKCGPVEPVREKLDTVDEPFLEMVTIIPIDPVCPTCGAECERRSK